MIYIPPQGDYYFRSVAPQLGIQETGWQMYEVGGFRLTTDLLIGGEGMSFDIEGTPLSLHLLFQWQMTVQFIW